MTYFLSIVCFITTFANFEAFQTMGPVGNIITHSMYPCKEVKLSGEVLGDVEIKSIDGKGTKAFYGNLTIKIPIDNTIDHSATLYKWESGGWKNIYNVKGKFCVDFPKIFPKLWAKMRAEVKPPIDVVCPVKPGIYVLNKFQCSSKDFTVPAFFYGKLKLKLIFSKNTNILLCEYIEADFQAP